MLFVPVVLRLVLSLQAAAQPTHTPTNVSGNIQLFVDPRLVKDMSGFNVVVGKVVKVQYCTGTVVEENVCTEENDSPRVCMTPMQ